MHIQPGEDGSSRSVGGKELQREIVIQVVGLWNQSVRSVHFDELIHDISHLFLPLLSCGIRDSRVEYYLIHPLFCWSKLIESEEIELSHWRSAPGLHVLRSRTKCSDILYGRNTEGHKLLKGAHSILALGEHSGLPGSQLLTVQVII
jgi:hypothetical protein